MDEQSREDAAAVMALDVRHLIVCDTQFGWIGQTTLKLPEIERLVARGWLAEGGENAEYDVTNEGRAIIDARLRGEAAHAPSFDRRFSEMLVGILGEVQTELGFSDEEKECSNGSAEILHAIRELKSAAPAPLPGVAGVPEAIELIDVPALPSEWGSRNGYRSGWNDCRSAILAAAPTPAAEGEVRNG